MRRNNCRSILLNSLYIQSNQYRGNNQYAFRLTNEVELLSGRSYREDIEQFLGIV
ncbi:MAG: hypothetical protein AAFO94_16230 [Bacteroidota bacterium]